MKPIVYGFDFGTSNSAISILEGNAVSLLPIGDNHELLVRSVMFFPEGSQECLIGNEAIRAYVSSGMRGRFISSFKSMLPISSFVGTTIYGKWFTPEELVGTFLLNMKQAADRLTGSDVCRVVLGRPVEFSKNPSEEHLAIERLTAAARIAGFDEVYFQLEPIAAALSYEAELKREELVFVADLGGGTTDFTVMRLSPQKRSSLERASDILSVGGVYIGGDTFSSQIMRRKLTPVFGTNVTYRGVGGKLLPMPRYIMETICDWKKIPYLKEHRIQQDLKDIRATVDDRAALDRLHSLITDNIGFSLFEAIELAKQGLSEKSVETILYQHSIIDLTEQISRIDYEAIIHGDVEAIMKCANQTLEHAGLEASAIRTVFLTGGTSKTPLVQQSFSTMFSASVFPRNDVFTSIAAGLARSIPYLARMS